uniref:clathrin interactor 1-like n=1 Tax=Oncorhynchus gorbuscha TaxID=8017 RepID=UPI001EAE9436|nr:clathrin interactor 1-like [Oncorhynchus gorbuscha]
MVHSTNVVMNYSDIESKVREVTNDDPWGPSGQLMGEIAKSTFMYEQFPEVMNMLWTRMLRDNKKNWRRVYKALLLLAYLIRNGSERVVTSAREHIYDLRSLENYNFVALPDPHPKFYQTLIQSSTRPSSQVLPDPHPKLYQTLILSSTRPSSKALPDPHPKLYQTLIQSSTRPSSKALPDPHPKLYQTLILSSTRPSSKALPDPHLKLYQTLIQSSTSFDKRHFICFSVDFPFNCLTLSLWPMRAGEMFDSGPKGKWDEDWDKSKGAFPFSEKLGEISDKIGSTIDDTMNKFRKNERDDSPDRISHNEEDTGRPVSGLGKLSEFRDEEETVTTTSIQISHATETTTTRKRGGIRSKTVDLGAAAHYTGDRGRLDADNGKTSASQSSSSGLADLLMVDAESSQTAPAGGSSDLICDFADFSSPAASASLPSSAGSGSSGKGEFGDWNAFSSLPAPTPPSVDLFDLIGSNHTSLTASQSITFSMCDTQSVGVANTDLPISRSQVQVAHRTPPHYMKHCYRWKCLIIMEEVYVVNIKDVLLYI